MSIKAPAKNSPSGFCLTPENPPNGRMTSDESPDTQQILAGQGELRSCLGEQHVNPSSVHEIGRKHAWLHHPQKHKVRKNWVEWQTSPMGWWTKTTHKVIIKKCVALRSVSLRWIDLRSKQKRRYVNTGLHIQVHTCAIQSTLHACTHVPTELRITLHCSAYILLTLYTLHVSLMIYLLTHA